MVADQVGGESFWAYLKRTVKENKWLVAFTVLFFLLMLLPLIFR